MRLLVDQNLARAVAVSLSESGFEVVHTAELGLQTAPDQVLLELCRNEGRVLVTGDVRLTKYLAEENSTGPSIIILRGYLRDIDAIPDIISILETVKMLNASGDNAVVSIQKDKLARIRVLPFITVSE